MNEIKILHLSDTHGMHRRLTELPSADILVHSGDFTMMGTMPEALDFLDWLCDMPYRHKVFIAGNHDTCLYKAYVNGLDDNVYYLSNSGVVIEGLYFWGVPLFMEDCINEQQDKNFSDIPDSTDILVTHVPPLGILDIDDGIHYGSKVLLERIKQIKPELHLFGHIHRANGVFRNDVTAFSNAAIMDEHYDRFQNPHILSLQDGWRDA